jgi:BASS family bile acid:Na+ symporter
MEVPGKWWERFVKSVHQHFLWLLIGIYVLAAVVPAPGLWLRSVNLTVFAPSVPHVSLSSALLALLLFNAGLGVRLDRLWGIVRRPGVLLVGVLANLVPPVVCILVFATALRTWHSPEEMSAILIGLALIAAMPIAGSSTAWVQRTDGDMALSVGLVVLSTCISPVSTPLVLHAVGWMAEGEGAGVLHALAAEEVGWFLTVHVLVPSLAGIAVRAFAGEAWSERSHQFRKLIGTGMLLVLCYANAALALPQPVLHPDWDCLAEMLVIVTAMCVAGFASGAVVAWYTQCDRSQRAALMFGLGMTNNGTGLVVAGTALAHLPAVMLPIIFYSVIQHIVAASVDRYCLGPTDMGGYRAGRPAPGARVEVTPCR